MGHLGQMPPPPPSPSRNCIQDQDTLIEQSVTLIRPMKLDYQFLAQIFENLMRAGGYYSLFIFFQKAQHTSQT